MAKSYSFFVSLIIWSLLWKQYKQNEHTDCIHQCGNISLPYPFGIGLSHCYFNSYFKVICKFASSSKVPFLNQFNLEIAEVNTFTQTAIVKIPSITACNGTEKRWYSPSLGDSPFYYYSNKFVSVGCDGYALLYDADGNIIRGCTSTCAPDSLTLEAGNQLRFGFYNSCQFDMPLAYDNKIISMSVVSTDSGSGSGSGLKHCRSAALMNSIDLPNLKSLVSPNSAFPVALHYHLYYPTALGSSLFVCCCIGQCWWCKTRKTRREIKLRKKYFNGKLQEHLFNQEDVEKTKLFTENEVKKSTENFNEDRIIGKGGQGTVYKGMLSDGKLIAVKKSISLGETQWKELVNEVLILSNINHRNVVKLLGCCLEMDSLLLVYEFIPNGTLSEFIHNPNEEFQLTWDIRLRIASEVAGAIAYLHSSCSTPIYHRDIKTSNILLDHKYTAKVCDFGISRSTSIDQTHLTTLVRGTFGYLDPQYFRSNQFSEKSDVYSFGVVLVEMLTGQKPIIITSDYATSLVTQFISLTEDSAIFEMLDPIILGGNDNVIEDIMVVVNLAKRCLNHLGAERPTMMQVTMELACLNQKEVAKSASLNDKLPCPFQVSGEM
ncbi:unnamed protein product [Amaranthus hypochondriacus]